MHIVTYNEEKFGTLKEAVFSGQPGAIAVIGVFFEVCTFACVSYDKYPTIYGFYYYYYTYLSSVT